ncbi:MAG: hypothetical protein DRR00_30400 [Candidatus Parabeggiatoa sp. nov. 3]|nr:MAG: hypothetical protein DRR00_30400 [Gammaproteobacteria bacterium]
MTEITAKILDSTHLELSQPIFCRQGNIISIFIPDVVEKDVKEEDNLWMEASKNHFLAAYDEGDAIYDKL